MVKVTEPDNGTKVTEPDFRKLIIFSRNMGKLLKVFCFFLRTTHQVELITP